MSTVVLYCWRHSESASVLLYFTFECYTTLPKGVFGHTHRSSYSINYGDDLNKLQSKNYSKAYNFIVTKLTKDQHTSGNKVGTCSEVDGLCVSVCCTLSRKPVLWRCPQAG